MTDWERVERLRGRGTGWAEIAEDPKVAFSAPAGADPGRALKTLYFQRRSRSGGSGKGGGQLPGKPRGDARSPGLGRSRMFQVGIVAVVLAVAIGGIAVYYTTFHPQSPVDAVVTYCGGDQQVVDHYHVLLIVDVNGVQEHLPYDPSQGGDIGVINAQGYTNPAYYCPNGEAHALHTHDGSGIVHLELPGSVTTTPTLGDFFQIWGEPLSPSAVWAYTGTVTTQVLEMDTGSTVSYSSNPGSVPLRPAQGSSPDPYTIPSNLVFNGQFGSGESSGYFSGEIIWLNVTTGASAAGTVLPLSVVPAGPPPVGDYGLMPREILP